MSAPKLAEPAMTLLCKLVLIAVHAEEHLRPTGHQFDRDTLSVLLSDPEVSEFINGMLVRLENEIKQFSKDRQP